MKKKSLITMLVALTLFAVVGVGATLAYLSSTTETLTNTFTVGSGISIKQDETNVTPTDDDNGPRTEKGNDYTDIHPGDVLVKDPTVTVEANSTECYVFMQVTGADELVAKSFTFGGYDPDKWILVDEDGNDDPTTELKNGTYRYFETVKKNETEAQTLAPLFETVTYDSGVDELATDLPDVTIKSCAVQAANMGDETTSAEVAAFEATVWTNNNEAE